MFIFEKSFVKFTEKLTLEIQRLFTGTERSKYSKHENPSSKSQLQLFEEANSVALQSDGKIIVGGKFFGYFSVFRFNPNGTLDTSFGSFDGVAIADFKISSGASHIKVLQNDKIVGVGQSIGENQDFAAARFNPGGSLDNTFHADGKITTTISSGDDTLSRLVIQADGKIVGAGSSGPVENKKITLARYLEDSVRFDYDGDGRADISVFRPADGIWYLNRSTQGFASVQFGLAV